MLIKYPRQTTAVDIWSAGVILLCLLSRRYPFFRAHDDMSAMAQIVGLFGSVKCAEAAHSLGEFLLGKCCLTDSPKRLRATTNTLRHWYCHQILGLVNTLCILGHFYKPTKCSRNIRNIIMEIKDIQSLIFISLDNFFSTIFILHHIQSPWHCI